MRLSQSRGDQSGIEPFLLDVAFPHDIRGVLTKYEVHA